ncbi:MAG: hypothetical protein AB7K68_10790 [Bacteriovoracia bacterium]
MNKQNSLLVPLIFFLPIFLWSVAARAGEAAIEWPSRNSKVVCGGTVDDEPLDLKVMAETAMLKAVSKSDRVFLFIDLHKPGQVRFLMNDSLTDQEFAMREQILAKLNPAEADLVSALFANRLSDFYTGLTEGFVHLVTAQGTRTLNLSCQEVARAGESK